MYVPCIYSEVQGMHVVYIVQHLIRFYFLYIQTFPVNRSSTVIKISMSDLIKWDSRDVNSITIRYEWETETTKTNKNKDKAKDRKRERTYTSFLLHSRRHIDKHWRQTDAWTNRHVVVEKEINLIERLDFR